NRSPHRSRRLPHEAVRLRGAPGADQGPAAQVASDEAGGPPPRRPAAPRRPEANPAVLRFGDLTLDPASRRVTRGGAPLGLTSKEFAILEVLMRSADETVSRTHLVERVWDEASEVLDNLVDAHVSHLRKKIDRGESPVAASHGPALQVA